MSERPESERIIRIGGGSAFFIDSALAVPQLLGASVDYIILDYLAEGAMGLLGRMRAADPASGYPADFMDVHIGPQLAAIAAQGVRIVANAGGVNPAGLAAKLRARCTELGLALTVASIAGDDLFGRADALRAAGTCDMANGAPLPATGNNSINAYLGAFPIAAALGQGADIVITGRVVDSALALGPLIHEFGWGPHDFDRLAAGTVAGHLIECGAQATGGTFTDWAEVTGWANIGSPIAECAADGSLVITKPDGSGGLVSIGTVAEQLLYEVGDPQAYFVPDVTCDFTAVRLEQVGPDRVRVTGARGLPPTATLKACATFDDGWRATAYQPIIGPDAVARAHKQAAALFARGRALLAARGLPDFRATAAVLIGAGEALGPRHFNGAAQEVVLKLVVDHDSPVGAGLFAREQLAAISAMSPGTSIGFGTQVAPLAGLISFLIDKAAVMATIDLGNGVEPFAMPPVAGFDPAMIERPPVLPVPPVANGTATLEALAFARSGEKGETINIAVIARDPVNLPALRAALTPVAVAHWLAHLFPGDKDVTVFDVPGIAAINLVLGGALPGGINASTRLDPAAKSVAQQLMAFPVAIRKA
ncbi:MAG: acyclic terpene utilization AtuA family protein [Polymorphobacter sp.]